MLKKLSLSVAALVAAAGIAYAGGAFQGYPLIGGDGVSNCLSYGNNNVCNQYQPAGPSSLAPTATVPADTNVQGAGVNANPATVALPAVLTGATILDNTPLTGATITVPAGTARLILTPAGTIAAQTVVLPAATGLYDGQIFTIHSTQTVTTLTVTAGSGTTVTPTITTVTAAAPIKLIYSKVATTWLTF